MSEAVWLAIIPVIGTVLVNLISILPKIKESHKEVEEKIEGLSTEVQGVKDEFTAYKAKDDDRYAQNVRVRILSFDDRLCNSHRWPSESNWKQALTDCDTYEAYIKTHENFINGIGEDAIESIRTKYRTVKNSNQFGNVKENENGHCKSNC